MQKKIKARHVFAISIGLVLASISTTSSRAQPRGAAPVTVVNPETSPVPTADTFAPGRMPQRFGPVRGNVPAGGPAPSDGFMVVPAVDAGQTFILTHLHAEFFSNVAGIPLVAGKCSIILTDAEGTENLTQIPLENGGGTGFFHGTFESALPLEAGEGLNVLCVGEAAGGVAVAQAFRATAVGYVVPR